MKIYALTVTYDIYGASHTRIGLYLADGLENALSKIKEEVLASNKESKNIKLKLYSYMSVIDLIEALTTDLPEIIKNAKERDKLAEIASILKK